MNWQFLPALLVAAFVAPGPAVAQGADSSTESRDLDVSASVVIGVSRGVGVDASTRVEADGDYAGGSAGADANAHAGIDAGTQWTVGPDGLIGTADVKIGVDAQAHAGAEGRLGTEDYNVHAGADVKISAEMAAELKARILAGSEGLGAEAEAKAGVSVGAEGVVKGGVTIWGIPFDVVLSGGVKAGAEASAKAGALYDAKTGKLTLELGASAVAGVGAGGSVTVEIGAGQLFGKVLDQFSDWSQAIVENVPVLDSAVDNIVNGAFATWYWAQWLAGGQKEMEALLALTRNLHALKPPALGDAECPCNAEADIAAYTRVRNLLGKQWTDWNRAYGAVNGWAVAAKASEALKDAVEGANNALNLAIEAKFGEEAAFVHDKLISLCYSIGEDMGNGKVPDMQKAKVEAFLGDGKALADNLVKWRSTRWADCKTNEERIAYLQLILDIRSGIRQWGDANEFLTTIGIGSTGFDAFNTVLKETDEIAQVAQIVLDAWRTYEHAKQAAEEASKYFSSVSEAMRVLEQMRDALPLYMDTLQRIRDRFGKCQCGSSCQCTHCANKQPPPNGGGGFHLPDIPPVVIEDPFPHPPTEPPTTIPEGPGTPQDGPDGPTGGDTTPTGGQEDGPQGGSQGSQPSGDTDTTGSDTTGGGDGPGGTGPTGGTETTDSGDGPSGTETTDTETTDSGDVTTDSGEDEPDIWTNVGEAVKTTVEVIAFPIFEHLVDEAIGRLTQKYPVIGEIFAALGIDTGSIMSTIRNIWGVLTGPGDLASKLQQLAQDALEGLKNMLLNLIDWGLNKLKDWLMNTVLGFMQGSGSDNAFVAENPGEPDFLLSVVKQLLDDIRKRREQGKNGETHIIVVDPLSNGGGGVDPESPGRHEVRRW